MAEAEVAMNDPSATGKWRVIDSGGGGDDDGNCSEPEGSNKRTTLRFQTVAIVDTRMDGNMIYFWFYFIL